MLYVLLYEVFGWKVFYFVYLFLLLRFDGNGKLFKCDGDCLGFFVFFCNWIIVEGELYFGYRENGYMVGVFINMFVFLGWNLGII